MNRVKDDVIKSEITNLSLNEATYKNVNISPTLINFFFGKNGAGKTTISNNIKNNLGITWRDNRSQNDYDILVYNKEFIDDNLKNYESLPGVYTLAKENIETKEKIDIKINEKEKLNDSLKDKKKDRQNYNDELTKYNNEFKNIIWKNTSNERSNLKLALSGSGYLRNKDKFKEKLLSVDTTTDKDIDEITNLYNTAFDDNSKLYYTFNSVSDINILDNLDVDNILDEIIVNSSDTAFSKFIKNIDANNWVQQGYKDFHDKTDGVCPYCQQNLPNNFVENIKNSYDEDYKNSINSITKLKSIYTSSSNSLLEQLENIPSDIYPNIDIKTYTDKISILKGLIIKNINKFDEKLSTPSKIISLDNTSDVLTEISNLIDNFNKDINFNNDVVKNKKTKQENCSDLLWSYFATKLNNYISDINKKNKTLTSQINKLNKEISSIEEKINKINTDINILSKNTLNTEEAVKNINKILKDCGFESFTIKEKENNKNVYEIIRPNGAPAKNLSEGEHNFIAFLYFYNRVKGKLNAEDESKDKIVIIDDPVSSMDSNSLFIISSLVRELIDICANNAEYQNGTTNDRFIKQIFILTHNAYFHNEISYNRIKNHIYVNLYLISKIGNESLIKNCIKEHPDTPSVVINYNPVQNSYAALWSEYNEVTSPISLMSVIRKILEYYFLQMCGYDGSDLRKIILQDNKDKFISVDDEGNPDTSDYQLAQSMLAYIKIQDKGFNEGYFFNEPGTDDISTYKKTFKMIFELMEQNQHYQMMMNSVNNKGDE